MHCPDFENILGSKLIDCDQEAMDSSQHQSHKIRLGRHIRLSRFDTLA